MRDTFQIVIGPAPFLMLGLCSFNRLPDGALLVTAQLAAQGRAVKYSFSWQAKPPVVLALRDIFSAELAHAPESVSQVRVFLQSFYECGASDSLREALRF